MDERPREETEPRDPEDVVDDRVEQHAHEQRQRAHDEPKRESAPDRTVGTSSAPDAPSDDETTD